MKRYNVTYYYLATGMEGRPDIKDYGEVMANSKDEAKKLAAKIRHPNMSQQDLNWVFDCLTAKEC